VLEVVLTTFSSDRGENSVGAGSVMSGIWMRVVGPFALGMSSEMIDSRQALLNSPQTHALFRVVCGDARSFSTGLIDTELSNQIPLRGRSRAVRSFGNVMIGW